MDKKKLAGLALEARENAYAPYSGFSVGAALLCADGRVYTGCNIENCAYGPGNCAERTAFFKALSDGVREFVAIAVCGGQRNEPPKAFCPPCGICRQVMAEFCGVDFEIIFVKSETEYETHTLGELLPLAFGPGEVEEH